MKHLTFLIDADDTILDFGICERKAINLVIEKYELQDCEDFANNFTRINHELWRQFEDGKISIFDIIWKRFEILFFMYNIKDINPYKAGESYKSFLECQYDLIDGAVDFLERLKQQGHQLYCITNGTLRAQTERFRLADLNKYFCDIFISETIGFRKPQKEYFEFVINHIVPTDNSLIYVVGDSLTADIAGGATCGLHTIWYNRNGNLNTTSTTPQYEVSDFKQLQNLIDTITFKK